MTVFDVIIVGGGRNGLACGAVLAGEGMPVLAAEGNPWLGGIVSSNECIAIRDVE